MTVVGAQRLREELERLKTTDRYDVVKAIASAREHGDLKENAEYRSRTDLTDVEEDERARHGTHHHRSIGIAWPKHPHHPGCR